MRNEPRDWILDLSWSNSIFIAAESDFSDPTTTSSTDTPSPTEASALTPVKIRATNRDDTRKTSFEAAMTTGEGIQPAKLENEEDEVSDSLFDSRFFFFFFNI